MNTILCIGSVLWDVIGQTNRPMRQGADVPGQITRQPGGVALNIAVALRRFGLAPILLSAVGRDAEGDELLRICAAQGIETRFVHRPEDLRTDIYMAIEDPSGLVAALADAQSLETAGAHILAPLRDGRLGSTSAPFAGPVALDGNLTRALLKDIAVSPLLEQADLRVAPASPGKATRLRPFLDQGRATLYVNLEEANLLAGTQHGTASEAAQALLTAGARRVLVTHGAQLACDASHQGLVTGQPPVIIAQRITGAGDMFMAAHIAAELDGATRPSALHRALEAAASHVAGDSS